MTEITEEQVVMTPRGKTSNSTTLLIERRAIKATNDKMHVAGGEHTGIVINKETVQDVKDETLPELSLEFRVFLVSGQTGKHTQESRTLRFWFRDVPHQNGHINGTNGINGATNGYTNGDSHHNASSASVAQDFFRELVSPQEFPRDYVGFIKKIMKQMQHGYKSILKVEIVLKQLEEVVEVARPPRPGYLHVQLSSSSLYSTVSGDENSIGNVVLLSVEKVLELIESAYPNPITLHDLAKDNNWDDEEVAHHLAELQSRGLVKAMDHGAFTRQQSMDTQVTVVKQMPTMASSKQPTIAIITAQYCEKLAVDAMIENKETFVRYTTVGESNVYTMGNIGAHRIVCTKLPSVGHTREAMTAAGNTTTRLLGTFQKVDYVFLVGVAGGVPHYTDYNKHVRLGDVVVSYPYKNNKHVYVYCDSANKTETGYDFEVKPYGPSNLNLQEIAANLKMEAETQNAPRWNEYLQTGLANLENVETDYKAPPPETDKLYMSIGEGDLIEVAHPQPAKTDAPRLEGCPKVHLAMIGSGRRVVKSDQLRQQFAAQFGALAFDCEFDTVIESVLGNCKDSFVCIRGISDYKDGTRRKEWQPYASLAAASVMKAIICGMDPPTN
ncbi:uncharacterized protein [Atheta coriaria]|uniref:uncharacterized protein isoform X2 n=1 Tax=Dalotia coriaria TaxID=877792 RepID=UPI0031F3E83B